MIVEFRIGRSWGMWIDGKKSDREWQVGEPIPPPAGSHPDMSYVVPVEKLIIAGRTIEYLGFEDDPEGDHWIVDIDGARLGPSNVWVKFADESTPRWFRVEFFWYPREDDPTVKIRFRSGEWEEVNETHIYICAEEGE